jgi:methyl-CpG-binding domain protein 4
MRAPQSPYNLIQEHVQDDPWRVFVVCIFCNLTKRLEAEPTMWEFFRRWPDATSASKAKYDDILELIKDLGLGSRRAKTLIQMSSDYLTWDGVDPKDLYGIGEYADAAYRIFCLKAWNQIPEPKDGALKNYWKWINNLEVTSQKGQKSK